MPLYWLSGAYRRYWTLFPFLLEALPFDSFDSAWCRQCRSSSWCSANNLPVLLSWCLPSDLLMLLSWCLRSHCRTFNESLSSGHDDPMNCRSSRTATGVTEARSLCRMTHKSMHFQWKCIPLVPLVFSFNRFPCRKIAFARSFPIIRKNFQQFAW